MDVNRLFSLVLVILISLNITFGLDLSVYQTAQFTNPVGSSEFTRFTRHNETGTIYIGASDALYQLESDFVRTQMVDTNIKCEDNVASCPNYNKILVINYANDTLITCGSENYHDIAEGKGTCNIRNISDISQVFLQDKTQVVPSGLLTTEAIIAPGPDGQYLYVATTYNNNNNRGNIDSNIISQRILLGSTSRIFFTERSTYLSTSIYESFNINFINIFSYDGFTYFVTHQRHEYSDDFISKISRVCHGDDSRGLYSFTEVTLQCQGQNGNIYNLIQAANVGPAGPDLNVSLGIDNGTNVLYGAFAKSDGEVGCVPSMQSALCIFKLEDIENALYGAVAGCFASNTDQYSSYRHEVNYLYGSCPGLYLDMPIDRYVTAQLCSPSNWRYAKGTVPLVAFAVIEWSDITPSSVITTTHRNHTIAFVGTMQGDMVKVHIEDNNTTREYERFHVGSHVLRDAEIDSNQEQLTILTKQQLLSLSVSKCDEYTTCDDCIGSNGGQDGDPYCGWCTLENRCTLHDSCPMADVSTRWLPYNSAQCVGISNVAPYDSLPKTVTEQQITLTVEQLPDLTSDNFYQCIFDNLPAVYADKNGYLLTCTTPAAADIPAIPTGNDHVTMTLSIYSTETSIEFEQTDFYFYECNLLIGCVSCTNSSWACDWCIYSNMCTHDSDTCSNNDDSSSIISGTNKPEMSQLQGLEKCPQLLAQDGETLIPNGVSREITVTGINLPADERINNYRCILKIENEELATVGTRNGNVMTCSAREYKYSADVQEQNVDLSVVWNNNRKFDDIYGVKVTLYKCSVKRPDCSRCLSNITTRSELNCGWCITNDVCTVQERSQCSGGWISLSSNQNNCPRPVVMQVFPPSGPVEGNSVITLSGTDFGKQFADIESIQVGTTRCTTAGLEEMYAVGSSVSCRTTSGTVDSMEAITVTVRGMNGNTQQSTEKVFFTYRDPSITSFEPVEGPEAGGTMVTIRGQYLDACSHINATIGSAVCRINRMGDVINATTARCRATRSSVGYSHLLTVVFDEITEKQSEGVFTYRPNPIVSSVKPLKTIQSGGITLTVAGNGFKLAQTPQIVIYIDDQQFIGECKVHNDTTMTCKTPNTRYYSDGNSARHKRAPRGKASVGFIIADVTGLLTWSEMLEIYKDPQYHKFEPNPKNGDTLIVKGTNINSASSLKDVKVYIGTYEAVTTSLSYDVLTVQRLPEQNPGGQCVNGNKSSNPCVVVYHGNLEFYLGTLNYPTTTNYTSVILTVSVTIMILLIVLLIVISASFMRHNRKFKKKRDALILEKLHMLQRRVDEEITNLRAASNAPQPSITLPNHVKINPEDVIKYNQLTIGRSLGHGAFGEVFLADFTNAGQTSQVAVKSIQGEKNPSVIITFLEEGLIMKDFNHPNVLGLVGLTFDPEGNPLVVLPLMKHGDLKSFLKKTKWKFTTEQRLRFTIDAAKGMAYLAEKKFVHRDLAARNCMVDADLVVKIGDFGRSRDMEDDDYYISQDKRAKLPVKWMAPESLDRKLYNEKTDVWSFGILVWEIFTNGAKPYQSIANRIVYYHISSGKRLPCPNGCREDVYDIMLHCWNMNPKDRCTFQELTQKLSIILNLQTNETIESHNEVEATGLSSAMNRDSYLHPTEEEIAANETGDGKHLVNGCNSHSSLHTNATAENQGEVEATGSSSAMNRDSYLHPIEEEIAGVDDDIGKHLVNDDSNHYPHLMEQNNTAVAMEMTTLN